MNNGDNSILGAGIDSGANLYAFSDGVNSQTMTPQDLDLKNPGSNLDDMPRNFESLRMRQTVNEKLMRLRAMNPFIQIACFPNATNAVVLATPNLAEDIQIKAGAKYVSFKGTGDYFVSVNGSAQIPTGEIMDGSAPIFKPEGIMFYCEELQNVSVVSATAGVIVTASFYYQQ